MPEVREAPSSASVALDAKFDEAPSRRSEGSIAVHQGDGANHLGMWLDDNAAEGTAGLGRESPAQAGTGTGTGTGTGHDER